MKARVSPNPYSHNRSTCFQLIGRQKLEYDQCLDQGTRILAHLTYFFSITPNVLATCVKLHASRGLFVLRSGMLSEMGLSTISEWIPQQHLCDWSSQQSSLHYYISKVCNLCGHALCGHTS